MALFDFFKRKPQAAPAARPTPAPEPAPATPPPAAEPAPAEAYDFLPDDTPAVLPDFDGPERRNAARNHDEIRLWAEYLTPGEKPWLCDDAGRCGGLPEGERFVIVGDYNADPADGGSLPGSIQQLLEHPRVLRHATPRSEGALVSAQANPVNAKHASAAQHDTAQFGPRNGNFRVDYVLPSVGFALKDSGVFWPASSSADAAIADGSDHHLVWVDLAASRAAE